MSPTDADLVCAVRDGRPDAFGELVRRYAGRIRAVCWGKLGRRGPVDDMVQETFYRGFRSIATIEDPGKFGGWLYGIAVRACLDWRKAKERSQVSFGSLGADKTADDFPGGRPLSDPEEEDHRRRRVLDGVEGLPEIYREAVILFYYRKQSYEEIGGFLGISAAAVNARLTKARALLRQRLATTMEK